MLIGFSMIFIVITIDFIKTLVVKYNWPWHLIHISKNPSITNPSGSSFLPSYIAPECKNDCGKGRAHITKNLGFMSSGDYLRKKMSFRKMSGNYEEPLMNNASCTVIE